MSPSRIPRPGVSPNCADPRSPGSAIRSAPTSPAPPQGFKPNNPFAARSHLSPTQPTNSSARIAPIQAQTKRRPKPPSPDDTDSPSPSHYRRPIQSVASPESNLPRTPGGGTPRSCLRQPSTPALSSVDIQKQRARAVSAAADGRPMRPVEHPPMPLLFEPSFAGSREPSVPPHIRVRLRSIHQLGVVLGMDAQGISSKIDVPGLLARVDAAFNRDNLGPPVTTVNGNGSEPGAGIGGISSLPLPTRPVAMQESPSMSGGMAVKTSKTGSGAGGMMGMIKRLGRKSVEESGNSGGGGGTPAFSSTPVEGSQSLVVGDGWVRLIRLRSGIWCGAE